MKTLVAYFSHAGQNYVNGGVAELEHGNAEVLAGFAAQACGGDLFHIERVEPYPAEYKACPGATVIEGLAIKGSNAAASADAVAAWLA